MHESVSQREVIAALLRRVATKDSAAFEALYDLLERRVYNWCRARLGNDSDSADAAQDVWTGIYLKAGNWKDGNPFGWIYTITVARCADFVRRKNTTRSAAAIEDSVQIDAQIEARRVLRIVETCVERLPPEQLIVFTECILGKKSFSEVAQELAEPKGTIQSRWGLIKKKIDKALIEGGYSWAQVRELVERE